MPPHPPTRETEQPPVASGNDQKPLSPGTSLDPTHRTSGPQPDVASKSGGPFSLKTGSKPLRSSIPSFVPTSQVVKLQSTMNRLKGIFTPTQSSTHLPGTKAAGARLSVKFTTAKEATTLFPPTKPEVDGEDCLHDCESCTVALPRKWDIDESDELYGHVKGWDYHVIVATGKSDWVRDVIDEKGSLMEGIGVHGLEVPPTGSSSLTGNSKRRRVMLSASNMPTGGTSDGEVDAHGKTSYDDDGKTNVIVLPAWKFVKGVSQKEVSWFMTEVVASGPSNVDHLEQQDPKEQPLPADLKIASTSNEPTPQPSSTDISSNDNQTPPSAPPDINNLSIASPSTSIPPGIQVGQLQHQALILMCSHKTRDARCGQSAPLLRRELERHLRPLGLYRDLHDTRPNGVGIYFINHVGGHKYSANMMIYRRAGSSLTTANTDVNTDSNTANNDSTTNTHTNTPKSDQHQHDQAVQGIWLARVRPEDCENIVRYTVLQGKVVKPTRQLRGGFDRSGGLTSW